jgi:hypothetical protein
VLRLLPKTANEAIMLSQIGSFPNEAIMLSQIGSFPLFFIQFYCADHILSPAGDALSHHQQF